MFLYFCWIALSCAHQHFLSIFIFVGPPLAPVLQQFFIFQNLLVGISMVIPTNLLLLKYIGSNVRSGTNKFPALLILLVSSLQQFLFCIPFLLQQFLLQHVHQHVFTLILFRLIYR